MQQDRKEYFRKYRKENRERLRVLNRISGKKWRLNNPDKARDYNRESKERNRHKYTDYKSKYRSKNLIKAKAHNVITAMLRAKKIQKSACFCGQKKVEAHHSNYNSPLDVTWLCRKHHLAWHRLFEVIA